MATLSLFHLELSVTHRLGRSSKCQCQVCGCSAAQAPAGINHANGGSSGLFYQSRVLTWQEAALTNVNHTESYARRFTCTWPACPPASYAIFPGRALLLLTFTHSWHGSFPGSSYRKITTRVQQYYEVRCGVEGWCRGGWIG